MRSKTALRQVIGKSWRPLLGMLLAFAARPSSGASTDPCTPEQRAGMVRYYAAVKEASSRPSDTLYVPYPFPTTDRRILIDTVQPLLEALGKQPNRPAARERFLNAVRAQTVRTSTVRVEDWTYQHCDPEFPVEWYYLTEFYAADTGEVLARAAITNSGMLRGAAYVAPGAHPPSLPAPPGIAGLRAPASVSLDHPRYARAMGGVSCDTFAPCLITDSKAGDVFVYSTLEKRFYRVVRETPSYNEALELASGDQEQTANKRLERNQRLVNTAPGVRSVVELVPNQ